MSSPTNWTLYVDERIVGLGDRLEALGHQVHTIPEDESVNEIRTRFEEGTYEGPFVTNDPANFRMSDVPNVFSQGLVLVDEDVAAEPARHIHEHLQAANPASRPIPLDLRDATVLDAMERFMDSD